MEIQNFLLAALGVLFLLSSCKKDKNPTASGVVLEYGTNTPIENALVEFYDCSFGAGTSGLGSTFCDLYDSLRTTANGHFSFSMTDLDSGFPLIKVTADDYWDEAEWYVPSTHSSYEEDLILDPVSWIQLKVKNVDLIGENVGISFVGGWGGEIGNIYPGDVDTTQIFRLRGEREHILSWRVILDGVGTSFYDTLFYSAHDTIFYEILY